MPPINTSEAFRLAVSYHEAGRLPDAEALYRAILAAEPNHDGALHFLGLIAYKTGRKDAALDLLQRAAALRPDSPDIHSNLGEVYRSLGQQKSAIAHFERAIELQPDHWPARNNLGLSLAAERRFPESIRAYQQTIEYQPTAPELHYNLGLALAESGRPAEAEAAYRQAIALKSAYPEAYLNLAHTLRTTGRLEEAISALRKAIEFRPDYVEAHRDLAATLLHQGRYDEAIAAFHRALTFKADCVDSCRKFGTALLQQGRVDDALGVFRRATELNPASAVAFCHLGRACYETAHWDEAASAMQKAVQLEPGSAKFKGALGHVLAKLGRLAEAAAMYREALSLEPERADLHDSLGVVLAEQCDLDGALAAHQRAITLAPTSAEAHNNLGNALKDSGRLDDSLAAFRRAIVLAPHDARMRSNYIYALHFHPSGVDHALAEAHDQWNNEFPTETPPSAPAGHHFSSADRRLRIGYVSPDFCDHVIGRGLRPLFLFHDHQHFETFCYAGVSRPDPLTQFFLHAADRWRSTVGVSDSALAEIIRRDGIDILVDLTQHLAGNRLPVFSHHPAPVQVSFAGYPAGTGVHAIPYRISDRCLEVEASQIGWKPDIDLRSPISDSEPVLRLPKGPAEQVFLIESFWCYDPNGMDVPVNELPATKIGRITFGSLTNFCKINDAVLRLWARVLRQVRDSRLVLLSGYGSHRQRTSEFLEREGIAAHRVEFVVPSHRKEYLERYHQLDIALDPFPYGGHTTSLDALWMGLPVVSRAGERPVSRAGLSILTHLGLPELVTFSGDEYVNIAVSLAGDVPRLQELRRTLRPRMEKSVLMDAAHFARQVEAAYRAIWQHWCATQNAPSG